MTSPPSLTAVYRVEAGRDAIEARARALAIEQSVEMPPSAITDATVLSEIVGRVTGVEPLAEGAFRVSIALATATTGAEAGQLLNMLFGNCSIQDDVSLIDVELPPELTRAFGGPNHGLAGIRRRLGAEGRALTCSALKPQGLTPEALASLAGRLARGGLDFIKDDHGLADQAYSPFAERVRLCARAVAGAAEATGVPTRYLPSLSGDLDQLRRQVDLSRAAGLDSLLIAPLVVGLPAFRALVREASDMAFMTHPALAGVARLAPPLLLGRLFRLFGADATVFPNHGGRFGYSQATCRRLAEAALAPWEGVAACLPVPAGGMTLARVPELLAFYGADVMLLIGGNLLAAGERLTDETEAFTRRVRRHGSSD